MRVTDCKMTLMRGVWTKLPGTARQNRHDCNYTNFVTATSRLVVYHTLPPAAALKNSRVCAVSLTEYVLYRGGGAPGVGGVG